MKLNTTPGCTPEKTFMQHRALIKQLLGLSLLPLATFTPQAQCTALSDASITPESLSTGYNNYLEFTDNKKVVRHLSRNMQLCPWQVRISGLVEKPVILDIRQLASFEQVHRTYSLRCVEGWSAVIPWSGVMLKDLLFMAKPLPNAQYVRFIGHYDPAIMVGQRRNTLDWPYTEGLRLDEATHPLTILATGMYNKALPSQNGAPIRLVVPWKYGYKSIKAITEIQLLEKQPETTWQKFNGDEYGFFGNVNPDIAHPRWSQKKEVRLGEMRKRKTKLLNGYGHLQTSLYHHDDLLQLF